MSPWSRAEQQIEWYDVMQACENGHVITSTAKSNPGDMKNRCPSCGAKTLTQCPNCGVEIQGYHHIPGVLALGTPAPPPYCHECGEPFPWTKILPQAQVGQSGNNAVVPSNTNIFVVHGHDEEIKQSVARTLSKLGLNPIILHEQPNLGRTIIEKFEKNADVQFAVILLSPDDMAYRASDSAKATRPRARQNVVLELGYFAGRLGRERVFTLKKGDELEVPTDISGVIYTPYDPAGHWRFELVRELRAAGYNVDANSLL
jgi:predicted nucleotide-binding protein